MTKKIKKKFRTVGNKVRDFIGWILIIAIVLIIIAVALPFIGLVVVYILGVVIGAFLAIAILYFLLKWLKVL